MVGFDKNALLERKAQLTQMLQETADEYQKLSGAIQLCDAMIAELEAAEQPEEKETEKKP